MIEGRARHKVLFVHESSRECEFVVNTLGHIGYETVLADSLDMAREKLLNNTFKIILSEKKLTDGTGFEILNCVRELNATPFILISEKYEPRDDEGNKLLNFASLSRPFREKDLLETLETLLGDQLDADIVLNEAHYISSGDEFSLIDIEEFVCGKEIKYDIFINIGEKKFIKLSHGNEFLNDDQIQKLKMKGVTSLYMKRNDFLEYISMTVTLIKYMPKVNISAYRKSLFIQATTKTLLQSVILKEMESEAVSHAKAVVDSTMNMLVGCDEILLSLEFLKSDHRNVFAHSLNVALYSVMIARNLKWNSYVTLTKLAAGGMFHDIGKTKIPAVLYEIPPSELTASERKILDSHVEHGVEMLKTVIGIPEEVIVIIAQHHEDESGHGFPMGIKRSQIHPLSKVIRVADDFCEMMSQKTPSLTNILETIRILENDGGNKYQQECVAALKKCFKKRRSKAA